MVVDRADSPNESRPNQSRWSEDDMSLCVRTGISKTQKFLAALTVMAVTSVGLLLTGCGSGSGGGSGSSGSGGTTPPPPAQVQYVAPQDNVFVAAINPASTGTMYSPTLGNFAGARTFITGTIQAGTPTVQDQAQFAQVYKYTDGHIYGVTLLTSSTPSAVQISSESQATIDDLCSNNGANTLLGTTVNYVATQYYNDYANPANSVYFYRLPGPSGTCNTTGDIIHMVKLGMSSSVAPITALMPVAVIHNPTTGAITGFIVNEGTAITEYDENFQNRAVLYTPTTPINVAYTLATSGVSAAGGLFVLDGNIVYISYTNNTVSSSLFTVPNWSSTSRFPNSANSTIVFFSVNTSNEAQTPVVPTSQVYSMPLDGSAAPTSISTESGIVSAVAVAEYGTTPAWSVVPPGGSYTIKSSSSGTAAPITAITAAGNSGSFVVTANAIYYTTSTYGKTGTAVTYSDTQTGIVSMSGTVIQAPLLDSRFVAEERDNNGNDWLDIIRARNLSPVTVTSNTNSDTYTEDGLSGATLEVVSTSSNTVTNTLGTLPSGTTIMSGSGTLTASQGYVDGLNVNSTPDPTTRDLIYIDTSTSNSLIQLTTNLH
jgi:hypothetical protein